MEEKQESKKGQGRGGGLVKPNPMKKLNFWFVHTAKNQFLILHTICGIFRYKKDMKGNRLSEGVIFLVLHGDDYYPACSKLTHAANIPCFRDGIRCVAPPKNETCF